MPKWLSLMRTGSFRDRHGVLHRITGDIINRIAGNHRDDKPAHLIVGHPGKKEVPSFGIVGKLRAFKDELQFQVGQAVPEFEALVRKGFFKDVSAGLDSGLTKLNHIAFLSAQAPAIDGLTPIAEFSEMENDTDVVHLLLPENSLQNMTEFSSDSWIVWKLQQIARTFRSLKNYHIEKSTAEEAEKLIPEYVIEDLLERPKLESTAVNPLFSNPEGGSMDFEKKYNELMPKYEALEKKQAEFSAQIETLTAQVKALTDDKSELATQNAELITANKKAEFEAYAEKLIADKKILPDQKEGIVKELTVMDRASTAEFSKDGANDTPIALFKARLETGSVKLPDGDHFADRRGAEFSQGDDSPEKIGKRAREYRREQAAKGNDISAQEAYRHVTGSKQ